VPDRPLEGVQDRLHLAFCDLSGMVGLKVAHHVFFGTGVECCSAASNA
jgi:hypothetical protein